MAKIIKNDLSKYRKYLDKEAKKFKISAEDLSNLYDCFYMIDDDTYQTFKLNKMKDWFDNLFMRIEKIVVPELYYGEEKRKNTKKRN